MVGHDSDQSGNCEVYTGYSSRYGHAQFNCNSSDTSITVDGPISQNFSSVVQLSLSMTMKLVAIVIISPYAHVFVFYKATP
jgi:hypothetical protein